MRPILAALLVLLALPAAANASTLRLTNGVLTYADTTTSNANNVTIALSSDGSRITVTEAGRTSRNRAITITGDSNCPASGQSGSCAAASVKSISVNTDGSNDTITQATSLPATLIGGAGNDTITGGPGDDTFPGDPGADLISGGDGIDTADYGAAKTPVIVALDGQPGDGTQGENDNIGPDVEEVIGGEGDDVITGNDANNAFFGNAGNDTLAGGAGTDALDGGTGNDTLSGGDGGDRLSGGPDNDALTGDEADDTLEGGAGDDAVNAGAGDDTLDGGTGNDTLTGGDGVDTATYAGSVSGVRVVLDGKPGDGSEGENDNVDTERVIGSPGDDVLVGNSGPNALSGTSGNDRILGGKGADLLDGGTGDDILEALDGVKDGVACGDGEDGVVTDRRDVRSDCDYIKYRTLAAGATALHLSGSYVRAPVRCSPAVALGCSGRIYLKVGRKVVGSLAMRLTPGRRWVARIKVSRSGLRTLRRHRVTVAKLSVHDRRAIPTSQTIRVAR